MAAHDVFISYSSLDKTVADAVCHGLEAEGVRCWMAPRDVTPGMDWQQSLLDAIASAKAAVLVFTGNANDSPHVRKEITAAFEAGAVVIPFRLEAVEPQGSLRYHLTGVHWLDALTPPLEANVKSLAATLKRLLDSQAAAALKGGPAVASQASPPLEPGPPAVSAAAEPAPGRFLSPPPMAKPPQPAAPDPAPGPPPLAPTKAAASPKGARPAWNGLGLPLAVAGGAVAGIAIIGVAVIGGSGLGPVEPNTPEASQSLVGDTDSQRAAAPASSSQSSPPAAPETPARAEALLILRTPIENGPVFAGEIEEAAGDTPLTAPGATTVTTHQLVNALANQATEVVLVDAAGCDGHQSVPSARCLAPTDDAPALLRAANIDAAAPVVVFCQGPACAWSRAMAQAAAAAGWRNVFWYRGGLAAWEEAGGPTQDPAPLVEG